MIPEEKNHRFTKNYRESLLQKLDGSNPPDWDVIVIGGGITGAGILREAARRGYRTLLLEQKDFAWGSSSRSSKMIHGGLRYLASGNWKLTRESLIERERLLTEAPGLIERIDYYFTLIRGKFPGRWSFHLLLSLYDLFAGIKNHGFINASSFKKLFPGIAAPKLTGAYRFSDAITNDARLVMRVIQEGISDGGHALNYAHVEKLLNEQGKVCGVQVKDVIESDIRVLRCKVVINATGAWADKIQDQIKSSFQVRPLRGSHLVIPFELMPIKDVLTFFHPSDKRGVFVYPWEGVTVIGTTDLDHSPDLSREATIEPEELDYLLTAFNSQFPNNSLRERDILSTWAGIRPVINKNKASNPSNESRDHAIWSNPGLITVCGGKLTTFRVISEEVVDAANIPAPKTKNDHQNLVFRPVDIEPEKLFPEDLDLAKKLIGRYGNFAAALVEQMPEDELMRISNTSFCLAECRWIVRNEFMLHLDDLLLRRTPLGLVLETHGLEIWPKLQSICYEELGWDRDKWQIELLRYQDICNRHYSLPGNLHADAA